MRHEPPPCARSREPIDLDILSRHTGGDAALGRELLQLFAAQARHFDGILSAQDSASGPDLEFVVHRLKGAAGAVGAGDVAEAAGAIEARLNGQASAVDARSLASLVGRLRESLAAAIAFTEQVIVEPRPAALAKPVQTG